MKACLASRKKLSWDGIAKAWGVPATLPLNVVGRTGAGDVPQQPRPGATTLQPPWVQAELAAWVSESCEINLPPSLDQFGTKAARLAAHIERAAASQAGSQKAGQRGSGSGAGTQPAA